MVHDLLQQAELRKGDDVVLRRPTAVRFFSKKHVRVTYSSNLSTSMETISTPVTRILGLKCPIMLAGMNQAAGPELAAAVTNAGTA